MDGEITARALWLARPGVPEFRTEVVPPPGHGQLRLRAISSAISQGTEMLVYRGQVPPDLPLDLPTLAGSFGYPIKYGYALVGRVIDVGPGVEGWQPGDLAFVLHPHQSVLVVPQELATRLPPGLSPDAGVFTANLETAVNVLLDAPFHFGERVVVFGLGTVGLLVALLFKRAGASQVIGVDPLGKRRDISLKIGLDTALPVDQDLVDKLHGLTGGLGADIAVEASGSNTALQMAIDSVADEGTVMVVSWYGTKPATLSLGGHFHRGRVRIVSSQVGRLNPVLAPRWDRARRSALVSNLLSSLPLEELVSHRFAFEAAPLAYRLVDKDPGEVMQVVLTYGEQQEEAGG